MCPTNDILRICDLFAFDKCCHKPWFSQSVAACVKEKGFGSRNIVLARDSQSVKFSNCTARI